MKKQFLVPLALTLGYTTFYAQQDSIQINTLTEVVVSDSRFKLKRENSGKTVIRIDADEIARNTGRSVAELINSKSGIEINGSRSVAGQNLGYFIRGGNNRQVLVLVDGIQVTDPSQIANDFDLRLLDLNTIESIEIVKGAASTLYGNSASTAVISIKTKKSSKKVISLTTNAVFGTNAAQDQEGRPLANFTNSVFVNGTLNKFNYALTFANQFTDGLSAASGNNTELDVFSRIKADIKLGYQFSNRLKVAVFGSQSKFKTEIDGFPAPTFVFADTEDRTTSDQKRIAIAPELKYKNGSIAINAGYLKIDRETVSDFPSTFESERFSVDAFNKYVFGEKLYTIVGFNYQNSKTQFANEQEFSNNDPYANVVYVSDFGLNLNMGGRLNNHSAYGSHFVSNFNPSYTFTLGKGNGKFFGSYSTSFIAPSLFQLFDATFGNSALEPEENRTLEGGFEYDTGRVLRINALYFNRNEENTVLFTTVDPINFVSQYLNAEEDATIHGLELELKANPIEKLSVNANYTFTELRDGLRLRLPKHRANAQVVYELDERSFVGLNYQFVGERTDTDFSTFSNVILDSFSLVDFNISRTFMKDKLRVFGNLTNILNSYYEEIIGYSTRGRNFSAGLQLKF